MTTTQVIPSESKQQVVEGLKTIKGNIILTSSASGVAEAYLYEYKKQCDVNKIVTVTEVNEIHSQKNLLDESDLLFYIEISLSLNLCNQLLQREKQEKALQCMKADLQRKCEQFKFSMERAYNKNYHMGIYLNPILDYIKGKYDWEWLIANFDRLISNADKIQRCMYQYIKPTSIVTGPSRVILSAYDRDLFKNDSYGNFQVINLTRQTNYQQLKEEAMMILYHLYPILWRHHNMIERVLGRVELEQSYIDGKFSYETFITGLHSFYEAYHCIEASGCFISEDEFLSVIQDYISNSKDNEQKKKSKLYI